MKRLFAILLALFAPVAWATTTVTGTLQNLGTGTVGQAAFVRFWLRGCGGNQPLVNGTALIAPSQGGVYFFDIAANSSGLVAGTIYSTRDSTGLLGGDITCGTSTTSVWYGLQVFVGGKGGPEVAIHAKNGVTLNISQLTPISINPVVTAPTGDSTYLRLNTANSPLTGNLSSTGTISDAGGTHSGAETFNGAINANNIMALVNAGVFTNTQMNEYMTSSINGLNFKTEFQAGQGNQYSTDGAAFGVTVPSTATVLQSNGVAGYVLNQSIGGAGVGVYAQGRCNSSSNGARCWGGNLVAADSLGTTSLNPQSSTLTGLEVDVFPANASDSTNGFTSLLNSSVFVVNSVPYSGGAAFLAGGNNLANSILWSFGFQTQDGGAVNGANFGATCISGSCPGQQIQLRSFNGGSAITTNIRTDNSGDLQLNVPSGAVVVLPTNTGMTLKEGTQPVTGSGLDTCAGDSASHGLKCSYNNDTPSLVTRFVNAGPTYNAAGAQQNSPHIVADTATLSGGTVTVTLSGASVFTGATTFSCAANDDTGLNPVKVLNNSGSSITFSGTTTDVVRYICVGN
jgi:hypothetical protein